MMLGCVSTLPVTAQVAASPQIVEAIDNAHLVVLHGSVHPLVKTASDRGLVNESTSASHLLLVLNRPAEREAAFQKQLKEMHTPGSANYHRWLTPAQIGSQFGPADSDLQQVSGWLTSAGFQVNRVSGAKRFVEFSGTVGQINSAFHTQIHEYLVNGEVHHANSTEVRIPEALSTAVASLSPLNDFRPHPEFVSSGKGSYDGASRKFVPQYTLPSSYSPLLYGVSPADFATQYDLAPLYSASVNGSGVTIGIIDESNVDLTLTNAYRSVFGLKSNPVQVVLDGGDPGILSSSSESYLDVEIAGAVAPSATVNLYLSAASPYQDPLALAALRAIEDNQADVLSISWGSGEQELGSSGNQFWNAIWEQAAAQGQTVMVSSGDTGQLPDTNYLYSGGYTAPAVNGIASTPWNIAVGGTDFYYSDYASGAPSAPSYWNTTNDPTTRGSLKARLPEQVWNDAYGLDAIATGRQNDEIYASGGGASSCSTFSSSSACSGGYSKPAWQTGTGVPADGVRDIPDVSLFAANGYNFSGYVICDYSGYCSPDSGGNFDVDVIGGTSASAPAMAGIMALVVQKYGRQGQAATVLYPLAQQKPAAFHDITLGGNWDICISSHSQCTIGSSSYGKSNVYSAATGFDLASGLGSVDAATLVNSWNTVSFRSTTTTLQVSPTTITHGANVALSAQVSPASGSGTPTGDVAILTTSTLPSNAGQTSIALSGGAGSSTLNYLPGGTYQLTARYGGDSTFATSTSTAQTVTVSPEKSTLSLAVVGTDGTSASNLTYGIPVNLSAEPIGVNASSNQLDGIATGSIAFTVDSQTASVAINTGNIASWTAPALSVGSHTASASYSGDASFQASTSASKTFSVAKGNPSLNLFIDATQSITGYGWTVNPGGSITLTARVGPAFGTLSGGSAPVGTIGPTGTVTICLNANFNVGVQACTSPAYTQTVPLVSLGGKNNLYSTATATFTNLAVGTYGEYMPQFVYNGDANWRLYGLDFNTIIFVQSTTPLATSTATLTATPATISGNQKSVLTATITGSGSTAPSGEIDFYDNGVPIAYTYLQPSTTSATSTAAISLTSNALLTSGSNQIAAYYYGDSVYAKAVTNTVTVNATQTYGDFTLAPAAPQLAVTSGSSASLGLNLISVTGFNSTVSIACTPSSSQFSCSVTPSSATLNGTATASLTITAVLPTSASNHAPGGGPLRRNWPLPTAAALCVLLAVPFRRRRWLSTLCLFVLFISALSLGACGGGSGSSSTKPTVNGTPAGTYNVVLTATGNNLTHSVKVAVIVK